MSGPEFDWTPYGRHTPMFDWAGRTVTARLVGLHDGDTCRVVFDTGERGVRQFVVRVAGIDTPEIVTRDAAEKQHATAARDQFLELAAPGVFSATGGYTAKDVDRLLREHRVLVTLQTGGYDKYGRLLAAVTSLQGVDIAARLLETGAAHPYAGKTKQPWQWLA